MATQKEVGKHLSMSDRAVRKHLKAGVLPPSKGPGGYNLDACRDAYIGYLRARASGQAADDEKLDTFQQRARKEKAQADKTELEVARMRGELVEAAEVIEEWDNMLGFLRARILGLPSRLVPHILKAKRTYKGVSVVLTEGVRECLEELSGYDNQSIPGDSGAAAETDSK